MFDDQSLDWPEETTRTIEASETWYAAPGNLCLDFHGDPRTAELIVFSDGNHHMALREALQGFQQAHPQLQGIFYMTTPPGVVMTMLKKGGIYLGNLRISAKPNLLIGPDNFIETVGKTHAFADHANFMQSRGCALIVRHGNPKKITGIQDLQRSDIRIACSNPVTETASYTVYRNTLLQLLGNHPDVTIFTREDTRMVYSRNIHHREIPGLLATQQADVALVYYHLALRYARIFPDQIDYIPLADETLDTFPGHDITKYTIARLDMDDLSSQLYTYLCSHHVRDIYKHHGLLGHTG